jgi:hypothetical protein
MNNDQLLQYSKETIEKYYSIVDIKKTRGFTSKVLDNGYTQGEDLTYIHPSEADSIQVQIMKNYNQLNQRKLYGAFNIWLRNYEQKLLRKKAN